MDKPYWLLNSQACKTDVDSTNDNSFGILNQSPPDLTGQR
jgi:hypothetical protein